MENYKGFSQNMILRDYLALDRTTLANERTLFSYVRTFVGLMSAGVGMVAVLDFTWTTILGLIFIASSPIILAIGIIRFSQIKKKLDPLKSALREHPDSEE